MGESGEDRFWVYVIWNDRHQRYHVGQTGDLDARIAQHKDPTNDFSRFTKRFSGEWMLIHSEEFPTRKEALRRERNLKGGQGREWIRKTLLPGP